MAASTNMPINAMPPTTLPAMIAALLVPPPPPLLGDCVAVGAESDGEDTEVLVDCADVDEP